MPAFSQVKLGLSRSGQNCVSGVRPFLTKPHVRGKVSSPIFWFCFFFVWENSETIRSAKM